MSLVYGIPDTSGSLFSRRRRTGIGGSDAGALLGVSPYASALSVWEEKRGLAPDREPPSERMVWGTRLEGAILDGYAEDNRRPVIRAGRRFRRHPSLPFVIGHPDGYSDDRLLEVKTTAYLSGQWGEDGSADVPAHYFAQVQHYLILTGFAVADLLALVGGRELHTYVIERDLAFQEALIEVERTFWERHVMTGEPPEPDGSESAGAAIRRMFPTAIGEEVVATPEVALYADAYLSAKAERDLAQGKMDLNAQLMQRYMGSRERLLGPGFGASWANRQGSVSWKDSAARYRDLLVPHYGDDALDAIAEGTRGNPSRTFTLTRKAREGWES